MNTNAISSSDLIQDNEVGSDSDTSLPDAPDYYQRISAVDDAPDDDACSNGHVPTECYRHASEIDSLDNGYHTYEAESGMSSLHLNEEAGEKSSDEEEEEERNREGSDSAIRRAFTEDEARRNAPLAPENAVRVMDAMRRVSFGRVAPDWVGRVPEDQWIDQLRRLRHPPSFPSSSVQN